MTRSRYPRAQKCRFGNSRMRWFALLCVVGCSQADTAFDADPGDVVGATLLHAFTGAEVALSVSDARIVYAALKEAETEILEGRASWAATYIITFRTRDDEELSAYLEHALDLWMPKSDLRDGDREVPESAREVLLKYAEPLREEFESIDEGSQGIVFPPIE